MTAERRMEVHGKYRMPDAGLIDANQMNEYQGGSSTKTVRPRFTRTTVSQFRLWDDLILEESSFIKKAGVRFNE
jgi:hypothetical protein